MRLKITSDTSFSKGVLPFLIQHLHNTGWALLHINDKSDHLEYKMLALSVLAGQSLGTSIGYHFLQSNGENDRLVAHSEGISNPRGITPYFSLGCLLPSSTGGNTRIFDGRIAAKKIRGMPELQGVEIEYSALAYPGSSIRYPLVINDFGGVVRYRSKVTTNHVISSGAISEEEMYGLVDNILEESLSVDHCWQKGDLLFVNNTITLHDRLPFTGKRELLRVRYNDNLNVQIRF